MKRILMIVGLLLAFAKVYAQDPDIGGGSVNGTVSQPPAPLKIDEPVTFDIFAGSAAGTLAIPVPGGGAGMVVTIITSNIGLPSVSLFAPNYFGTPVITALPNGQYSIQISQSSSIPELDYTQITVSGKAVRTLAEGAAYYAGYSVSVDPGGYSGTNVGSDNPSSKREISTDVLPVRLISFKASKEGTRSVLSWQTSMETNSDRFDVERSADGKSWSKLGSVASHGESADIKSYSYIDEAPFGGQNLYRLRMVDLDGSFTYSRIGVVDFGGEIALVSVYPNPSSERLYVNEADLAHILQASLFDTSGRTAISSDRLDSRGLDVSKLSPGIYVLKLELVGGGVQSRAVLIAR